MVIVIDQESASANWVSTEKDVIDVFHCLDVDTVTAILALNASVTKDGMEYFAQNQFVAPIVIHLEDIANLPVSVGVVWDGLDVVVQSVRFFQAVKMDIAKNRWNASVIQDILASSVKTQYVLRLVTGEEDIAENLENADAKLDGGVRIAINVIHILDVSTVTATVHGNVTASQVGEECCAMRP